MPEIERNNNSENLNFTVLLPSDFDSFYENLRDRSDYSKIISKTFFQDSLFRYETTSLVFSEQHFTSILTLSEEATAGQNNGFYSPERIESIKKKLDPRIVDRVEYASESQNYSRLDNLMSNKEVLRRLKITNGQYKFNLSIDFGTIDFEREVIKLRNGILIPRDPPVRSNRLSDREYQNQLTLHQNEIRQSEENLLKHLSDLKSKKNQQIIVDFSYNTTAGYESFKLVCKNYALVYQNIISALYNESKNIYPARPINFQFPVVEEKIEQLNVEGKRVEEGEKNGPEIPLTKVAINLPDMSAFYEFVRNNQGRIEKTNGKQERMVLSNTEIKDAIFENEITDLFIDKTGFNLQTTLNLAKERILRNLGYYDENEQKLLTNLIREKFGLASGNKVEEGICRFCKSYQSYDSRDYIDFSFGSFNTENNKLKLVSEWKRDHRSPEQENLSDREFQERSQDHLDRLREYTEKVSNLENKLVTITTKFYFKPKSQQDFSFFFKTYSEIQRVVMESIYEVEGFQSHDIEINYAIPKLEGEDIITTDPKPKEDVSIKTADELKEIQMVKKRKWSEWDGFDSIGGQEGAVTEAKKLVYAIKNPEVYKRRGVKQPKGILLYGPPGTGKTMLAKAVAKESEAEFFSVSISDIGSKWHGESERMMQEVFDNANSATRNGNRAIIYFDEIDSIAPNRDSAYEVSRKILSVILQNMDGIRSNKNVTIIAATNRPEDVDPAIKRSGRFDKLIEMGPPDKNGRASIFKKHIENIAKASTEPEIMFNKNLDFEQMGNSTDGMNGADIANLINQTLEEKLIKELEGTQWTPTTTQEILDMIPKLGRITKEQRHLGFILHK